MQPGPSTGEAAREGGTRTLFLVYLPAQRFLAHPTLPLVRSSNPPAAKKVAKRDVCRPTRSARFLSTKLTPLYRPQDRQEAASGVDPRDAVLADHVHGPFDPEGDPVGHLHVVGFDVHHALADADARFEARNSTPTRSPPTTGTPSWSPSSASPKASPSSIANDPRGAGVRCAEFPQKRPLSKREKTAKNPAGPSTRESALLRSGTVHAWNVLRHDPNGTYRSMVIFG